MKRQIFWYLGALFAAAVLVGMGFFAWRNLRGAGPALKEPSRDITALLPATGQEDAASQEMVGNGPGENKTGFPLTLPAGFSISIFAKDLPGARVLVFDPAGNLWVSRTTAGAITLLEIQNGIVVKRTDVLKGLRNPHGLVFDPADPAALYFAEENRISRFAVNGGGAPEKITDLPSGGGHFTRTLLFGADGKLYVSAGSSCNVCVESDARRAAVFSLNKDGSDLQEVASGLRNSVFLINHPTTGKIWATEMGRDLLGDNVPPDEVNIIDQGGDYGWPYCYAKNVHDDFFDPRRTVSCQDKIPSQIDIQAHSAPLGLAFVPNGSSWPEEYRGNLLVAFHGSWNRSVPTGYKVVSYRFDGQDNPLAAEDFIAGWLVGASVLGRPVALVFEGDALYLSDDKAGVIYKISYR